MRTYQGGIGLIELVIYLAVLSIVLSQALPAIISIMQTQQQVQALNQLLGALHYGRSAAVLEHSQVSICPGQQSCRKTKTWEGALLIFKDRNLNGQLDSDDQLLRQLEIANGYSWQWSNFRQRPYAQFKANGTPNGLNGTFTLCYQGQPVRQITINSLGRIQRKMKISAAVCT